jgi:hypothetical protein
VRPLLCTCPCVHSASLGSVGPSLPRCTSHLLVSLRACAWAKQVIWMNRRGVMVDPPPHSSFLLQRYGIHPRLIKAVVLTHCHADHDAGTLGRTHARMFKLNRYFLPCRFDRIECTLPPMHVYACMRACVKCSFVLCRPVVARGRHVPKDSRGGPRGGDDDRGDSELVPHQVRRHLQHPRGHAPQTGNVFVTVCVGGSAHANVWPWPWPWRGVAWRGVAWRGLS